MKRGVLLIVVVLLIASASSVGASHADQSYDLPLWFRWDRSALDVIIVPPNHGQIVNDEGVLNDGDPNELTPFNSYMDAIEASVADWDRAVEMFGSEWLRSDVVTNVYVAGRDLIPPTALASPEIVITTDETKLNTLGVAVNTRPCIVDNSKFWIESFTYADMYNVNSQEYGHCLGLEHVVDNHPEHDAMAGQYVHQVGAQGTHLHCVSNLDVLGLEAVFGRLFNRPSPDSVSIPVSAYGTTCAPPAGSAASTPTPVQTDVIVGTGGPSPSPSATPTPTPTPSPTSSATPRPEPTSSSGPSPTPSTSPTSTPSPTPSASPSATSTPAPGPSPSSSASPEPDPSPSSTPSEPPTYARSVTLRVRGHLVASGRVRTTDGGEHCYARVQVTIQQRRSAGWRRVVTGETGTDGSFRVAIEDRPGRYRAVVTRSASEQGTCERAASPRRTHRH